MTSDAFRSPDVDYPEPEELITRAELLSNHWFGTNLLLHALPKVPTRPELPTAGEPFAYRKVIIPGTPDVEYVCLRDVGGTWGWRTSATG